MCDYSNTIGLIEIQPMNKVVTNAELSLTKVNFVCGNGLSVWILNLALMTCTLLTLL